MEGRAVGTGAEQARRYSAPRRNKNLCRDFANYVGIVILTDSADTIPSQQIGVTVSSQLQS